MIDAVSIEDWDLLFEDYRPEFEKKLNNIVDRYFEHANEEAETLKTPLERFKRSADIHFLKSHIRRKGIFDDTWLLNIPTINRYKTASPITKYGKMQQLKNQAIVFTNLLSQIDALDDLGEVFLKKEDGKYNEYKTYYLQRFFLNVYRTQLTRYRSRGRINSLLRAAGINDSQFENIDELLEKLENEHMERIK